MKKQNRFSSVVVCLFIGLIAVFASVAKASPTPPNLRTLIAGPSSAQVYSPYLYTVTVTNIGGSTASTVSVVVDLPETNTSPQKYILGTLSGIDQRCQVVARKLNCQLGNLTKSGPGQTRSFTFNLALPVSSRTLEIKATASTLTTPETNPLNNFASITPTPAYATNQLTSANMLVSSCTGRGLSSYLECELSPGSVFSRVFTLNADLTVTYYGEYIGQWDQFAGPQQLHMIFPGATTAEFHGFATTNTCFEGMTTFTPDNGYVSAYKVCMQ